jgi:hypothetical protein
MKFVDGAAGNGGLINCLLGNLIKVSGLYSDLFSFPGRIFQSRFRWHRFLAEASEHIGRAAGD